MPRTLKQEDLLATARKGQEIMADALGLSIVHVNRTLQQLRRAGLIELRSGVAILLQRDALAKLCDYRPVGSPPAPNRAA